MDFYKAFNNTAVKELLGVPDEDWNVVAVSPLGYPKGRKPLSEIASN